MKFIAQKSQLLKWGFHIYGVKGLTCTCPEWKLLEITNSQQL